MLFGISDQSRSEYLVGSERTVCGRPAKGAERSKAVVRTALGALRSSDVPSEVCKGPGPAESVEGEWAGDPPAFAALRIADPRPEMLG